MTDSHEKDSNIAGNTAPQSGPRTSGSVPPPKKIVFDDFQITRAEQQARVEEEKKAWSDRIAREEVPKQHIFGMAVPRLKSLRDEMLGGPNKLPFFRRPSKSRTSQPSQQVRKEEPGVTRPADGSNTFFADHERAVIRVSRIETEAPEEAPPVHRPRVERHAGLQTPLHDHDGTTEELEDEWDFLEGGPLEDDSDEAGGPGDAYRAAGESEDAEMILDEDDAFGADDDEGAEFREDDRDEEDREEKDEEDDDEFDGEEFDDEERQDNEEQFEEDNSVRGFDTMEETAEDIIIEDLLEDTYLESDTWGEGSPSGVRGPSFTAGSGGGTRPTMEDFPDEPRIEAAHKAYLDALRSFDSTPRRASETRDPRADFVLLLGELLDILREQVGATSAMFFWVNAKRQQFVLESAALDDRAYQFLAADKRFSIELDAVSRLITRRAPELISTISAQAEEDLVPYYRHAIGIASFAGMPVLFGDSLVAVLTVDSTTEDNFSPETLRILTSYAKLIAGLIRSYIEKYDLLAAARTLDAARKLHQIVSPDPTMRPLRDQRKNPDYVLRALTEAACAIMDWDWLAAIAFDDSQRMWAISSLQSKHGGAYVPPMTPISLAESLTGRCIQSGQSIRQDALGAQSIRYTIEEDRNGSVGHSFLVIPIRTAGKNYGALAMEHSEKGHYTSADVETLEHLARSAAVALEIVALGEMVGERALNDVLTGILNRRGLMMRAGEELSRAMMFDEPLTFALFEIDGAAELNSRFSQEDSDTIVLAIARLLRYSARPFDVIARAGEFAFAAVLIKMTDEEAFLWCEKMRKMIVSEVIAIGKRSFSVTVSIGISGARRDGTVEELVEGAELAIERAREIGGNNVIVY